MLRDLPHDGISLWVRDDPIIKIFSEGRETTRVAEGIYETHFAFALELKASGYLKDEYPFSPWMGNRTGSDNGPVADAMELLREAYDEDLPQDFGVCDHWAQIIERWPQIVDDEKHYIIALTKIVRAEEPASGGWRWHKWGMYIGKQEPKYEYIHDETDIDEVYCFHIFEIRG
jgi:hypothetical protein